MKRIKELLLKLTKETIKLLFYIFRIFKIDEKKIICNNFDGKGYGDSPKYIVEELLKNNHDFKIVWVVKSMKLDMPSNIKQIKIYSIKWIYELATSKFWINNGRFPYYVRKRKKQYYIQTWHGGLALKKIEYDAEENITDTYKKMMINDNRMIDLMISNSDFCTKMYRTAFKYNGEIIQIGTPRNDVLINERDNIREKIRKKLNIKNNEKILLYAPTFREDYSNKPYDINFDILKECLEEKTNYEWKIFIKLHPKIKEPKKYIKIDKDLKNVSDYSDMQELICACDLLITDYSSTMFEALIADKPVILYMKDIEKYANERGYYFQFDKLPFKISRNNKELLSIINNNSFDALKKEYENFCTNVGLNESGNASNCIVKIITNSIDEGEKNEKNTYIWNI